MLRGYSHVFDPTENGGEGPISKFAAVRILVQLGLPWVGKMGTFDYEPKALEGKLGCGVHTGPNEMPFVSLLPK